LPQQDAAYSSATKDGNASMPMDAQNITHGSDGKPDCKCGCDCSKKLDLLVQAIEARIGQSVRPNTALPQESADPDEWVESILSPLSLGIQPSSSSASMNSSLNEEKDDDDNDDGDSDDVPNAKKMKLSFAEGVIPPIVLPEPSGCCGSGSQDEGPLVLQTKKAPPVEQVSDVKPSDSSCCSRPNLASPQQFTAHHEGVGMLLQKPLFIYSSLEWTQLLQ
ncbi:hypothetical protein GGI12_004580, partial [Dipsacomyces acuminosporus]